jgi:isoquinoline 1-oxidoreductase alpha subunit
MAAIRLKINNKNYELEDIPGDTSLLWVLREHLGLTGTKYGCGIAQCGSCTIHIDGVAVKACALTVEKVASGQQITTIEGSSKEIEALKKAWIELQVPQCGYCQPGQIMQAATLIRANSNPSREQIISHMNGNLCRCGTYMRIIQAIRKTSDTD